MARARKHRPGIGETTLARLAVEGPLSPYDLKARAPGHPDMAYSSAHEILNDFEKRGLVVLSSQGKSKKGGVRRTYKLTLPGVLLSLQTQEWLWESIDNIAERFKAELPMVFGKWELFKGEARKGAVLSLRSALWRVSLMDLLSHGQRLALQATESLWPRKADDFFATHVSLKREIIVDRVTEGFYCPSVDSLPTDKQKREWLTEEQGIKSKRENDERISASTRSKELAYRERKLREIEQIPTKECYLRLCGIAAEDKELKAYLRSKLESRMKNLQLNVKATEELKSILDSLGPVPG
jgi:hypothetical protein